METVSQSPYHDNLFVYLDAHKAELRFSLHLFIVEFINLSNLTITQLSTNFWAILSGFIVLYGLLEIEPSVGVFRSFYTICPNTNNDFRILYAKISYGLFGNVPHCGKHGSMASFPFFLLQR